MVGMSTADAEAMKDHRNRCSSSAWAVTGWGPPTVEPVSTHTTSGHPGPGSTHPALDTSPAPGVRVPDTSRITPPARRVALTVVTDRPLDVAAHEAAVAGPESGAVVTFAGVVRDHDGGRAVRQIEYVGHPAAAAVLAAAVADVAARSPVEAVAVSHRLGELAIGDAALVVAVSAAHRQEAFVAAALLVDEVKRRLPVWKRQVFADGSQEWVACP
jgi:molybdopterin synthase catalytic subunit